MEAPIIALEWVGDMCAPSFLPNGRGSPSPSPTEEEQHEPVQDSLLEAYEESLDNDLGTVRRKKPPATGINSPIRLDGSRDLFSPESRNRSILRKPSDVSHGSPQQIERTHHHLRRQSFVRPRIVTETFKSPGQTPPRNSLPSSPVHCLSPVQEVQLRRRSREVFDVFFSDALRMTRTSSSTSSSEYSQSTTDEIFTTPPTSQKPAPQNRITSPGPTPFDTPSPPHRTASRSSRRLSSVIRQNDLTPPPYKAPFPTRSSPKTVDAEAEARTAGRNTNWAERSPFPAPPGQQPKRDFSFEPGLHAQERRCQEKFVARRASEAKREAHQQRERVRPIEEETRQSGPDGYDVGLRGDNEMLRREMAWLREEFRALREAVLESRR
jgi:hypothetical protein